MRRGDIVIVAMAGDYGKVRPALVVQHDEVNETHGSIDVCPLSTHLLDSALFRVTVEPSQANGLREPSQILVDKISAVKRERIRQVIGRVDDPVLVQVNRAMAMWLGL